MCCGFLQFVWQKPIKDGGFFWVGEWDIVTTAPQLLNINGSEWPHAFKHNRLEWSSSPPKVIKVYMQSTASIYSKYKVDDDHVVQYLSVSDLRYWAFMCPCQLKGDRILMLTHEDTALPPV